MKRSAWWGTKHMTNNQQGTDTFQHSHIGLGSGYSSSLAVRWLQPYWELDRILRKQPEQNHPTKLLLDSLPRDNVKHNFKSYCQNVTPKEHFKNHCLGMPWQCTQLLQKPCQSLHSILPISEKKKKIGPQLTLSCRDDRDIATHPYYLSHCHVTSLATHH